MQIILHIEIIFLGGKHGEHLLSLILWYIAAPKNKQNHFYLQQEICSFRYSDKLLCPC